MCGGLSSGFPTAAVSWKEETQWQKIGTKGEKD
jgi:hypothetical protein